MDTYARQWEFLKNNFEKGSLAHAFLLSGPDSTGIEKFVWKFAKYVYCLDKKRGCENCQNCKLIEKGSFPDAMVLRSSESKSSRENEKDMMEISIEQIRDAQHFLSYKPYYGVVKILVVEHAERISVEAQHSFLKTLEEPPGNAIIFLISPNPDLLLLTVASRCQHIKFIDSHKYVPSVQEEKTLKELSKVLKSDLAEKFSFVKNANIEGQNFQAILRTLQRYFREQLLLGVGVLQNALQEYSVAQASKALQLLLQLNYQASTYNINYKMALEVLLLEL